MREALICEAGIHHDILNDYIDDGPVWVEENSEIIEDVDSHIQRNFQTNKSLRRGFANIFAHAESAMHRGATPRVQNVLDVWMSSGEWPPVTSSYFQMGGEAADALRIMFEAAHDDDRWMGRGSFELSKMRGVDLAEEPAEIAALPHCRNDLEFGMVALMCGVPNF